jgi:hypothetical protein
MLQKRFVPPSGAFTRSVSIRFSHCDPAGIVYFPHYFDVFNGLIEDWYGQELGYDYAELITGRKRYPPALELNLSARECRRRNRSLPASAASSIPRRYTTMRDRNRTARARKNRAAGL